MKKLRLKLTRIISVTLTVAMLTLCFSEIGATVAYASDASFEEQIKNFPESYKPLLREMHKDFPNWQFVMKQLDVTWDEAVAAEASNHRSLVSNSSITSWKSTADGDYNWTTGKWTVYDGTSWVAASKEIIAYYMDPRNFLGKEREESCFQFLNLNYNSITQTEENFYEGYKSFFLSGPVVTTSPSLTSNSFGAALALDSLGASVLKTSAVYADVESDEKKETQETTDDASVNNESEDDDLTNDESASDATASDATTNEESEENVAVGEESEENAAAGEESEENTEIDEESDDIETSSVESENIESVGEEAEEAEDDVATAEESEEIESKAKEAEEDVAVIEESEEAESVSEKVEEDAVAEESENIETEATVNLFNVETATESIDQSDSKEEYEEVDEDIPNYYVSEGDDGVELFYDEELFERGGVREELGGSISQLYKSSLRLAKTGSASMLGLSSVPQSGTYLRLLYDAAVGKINPFYLASSMIQEQGTDGTSKVQVNGSGYYGKYVGIYNFFNVGAYNDGNMGAVERGMWYASQTDNSTGRPWNTPQKCVEAFVDSQYQNYISKQQDTVYYKRFNVKNSSNRYNHQYMTNIQGAAGEGAIMGKAYDEAGIKGLAYVFEIPVYKNMPDTQAPCPTGNSTPTKNNGGTSSKSNSSSGGSGGGGGGGGGDSDSVSPKTSGTKGTYSEFWCQGADEQWRCIRHDNSIVSSAWLCDDAVTANGKNIWYLLNTDGTMLAAPLVQDNTGNYYSLEQNHNGYYGMLRYESGTYDGIYLEFEQSHNGSFAAIKNQDGIDALKAKYGLVKFGVDNSNCEYTSKFK